MHRRFQADTSGMTAGCGLQAGIRTSDQPNQNGIPPPKLPGSATRCLTDLGYAKEPPRPLP